MRLDVLGTLGPPMPPNRLQGSQSVGLAKRKGVLLDREVISLQDRMICKSRCKEPRPISPR
jgi:hypothetical protein